MTEPTYSYVPGQGWIPESMSMIGTDKYGVQYCILRRVPAPGEKYFVRSKELGEAELLKELAKCHVHMFRCWGVRDNCVIDDKYEVYTLVPV